MLLLLALACKPDAGDPAAWALTYASVEPSATALAGLQVWNLYAVRWDRKQNDRYYLCRVVQEIEGDVLPPLEGCETCRASYSVEITATELDGCTEDQVADLVLDGVRAYGIGALPADLQPDIPYPTVELGWYLSFDAEVAEPMGYAYPQALDQGDPTAPSGWQSGEVYSLTPAYAWEL